MKPALFDESRTVPDLADVDRRLALVFGGLIFVLMVAVLLAGGLYLRGVMESEQDRLSTMTTRVLANAVSRVSFSGKYQARLMLEEIKEAQPGILYLRLIDGQGQVFAHSDPAQNDLPADAETRAIVRSVLAGQLALQVRRYALAGEPLREVSLAYRGGYDNGIIGVIQVGISEIDRQRALERGLQFIAVVVAGLLLLGIYATLRISAHFGSPIRQVARALERERAHLRTLLSSIPDLVWLKNADGVYLNCNASFERFFGASEAAIVGRTDYDFVDAELADSFRRKDLEAMNAGGPCVNEEWVTFADDGRRVLLETTKTPVHAPDGSLIGVLGVSHDITEHRTIQDELTRHRVDLEELVRARTVELEQARQAAEAASVAKSAFLANMSHEIRTPLNGIFGMANILRREGVTPRQAERLDTIDTSARHLLSLINDILDLSKIEAGKFVLEEVPVVVGSLLANVDSILSERLRAKNLSLSIDAEPVPHPLLGDATRLQQALLNYATNAVKFTEKGGVTLRVRTLDEACDSVRLRFEVEDTGIGIAPQAMSRLFSAFEQADNSMTRRYGGTGLGLAITRRLVELMGGEVGVQSSPGQGSLFWFTVRLKKGTATAAATINTAETDAEAQLREHYAGRRVLVVDDEPTNREIAVMHLEAVDLVVDTAQDGAEAIALAQTRQYAVILMDMQMPRINGLEATQRIRGIPGYRDVAIVAMTANAFDEDKVRCIEAGMNEFLIKPFDPDKLFSTLLRSLRPRPA